MYREGEGDIAVEGKRGEGDILQDGAADTTRGQYGRSGMGFWDRRTVRTTRCRHLPLLLPFPHIRTAYHTYYGTSLRTVTPTLLYLHPADCTTTIGHTFSPCYTSVTLTNLYNCIVQNLKITLRNFTMLCKQSRLLYIQIDSKP